MTEQIFTLLNSIKQKNIDFKKASELQLSLWNGEKPERQPLLLLCELDEQDDQVFKMFTTKETHFNSEKMFLSGLRDMMMAVYGGAGAVPSIRANMGCGIFPTLFGIKQDLFDDKMPWVQQHLSKDVLSRMGPEDLIISDEFKASLEHMAYIAHLLDGTGCKVYPLDLQGAFDTAHIVYGDEIFYDLYDDPDFVHHLLDLSCEAIFMGMEECFKVIPEADRMLAHYNCLVLPRSKGGVKLSEDTSTLLSKNQIDEFVSPYMNKILEHFGGGYIHYCGKNPHLFETVMNAPLAFGLNLGNIEKHNAEEVLRRCASEDKVYFGSIPKDDGETLTEYFKKHLSASMSENKSLLLLQYVCKKQDRTEVLKAWDEASHQVMGY